MHDCHPGGMIVDRECDSHKVGVKDIERCVSWWGGVMVIGVM